MAKFDYAEVQWGVEGHAMVFNAKKNTRELAIAKYFGEVHGEIERNPIIYICKTNLWFGFVTDGDGDRVHGFSIIKHQTKTSVEAWLISDRKIDLFRNGVGDIVEVPYENP